jgi:hypothetical protein
LGLAGGANPISYIRSTVNPVHSEQKERDMSYLYRLIEYPYRACVQGWTTLRLKVEECDALVADDLVANMALVDAADRPFRFDY